MGEINGQCRSNINPNYSENIDVEKDLYAYIDESGDECFDFSKSGASKWFNVSAIITTPAIFYQMIDEIKEYHSSKNLQRALQNMSSKELKHKQKKDVYNSLNPYSFITIHSLFYKPEIDPSDNLVVYPSMYFVGIKNVIERITWCVQQCGKRRGHVLISNRNRIKSDDLAEYLFRNSVLANRNLYYENRLGIVALSNFGSRIQFLFADYSAYTLRFVFEENGTPPRSEPYYFDMFQRGKLFYSEHPKYTGVLNNGLKVTPSTLQIINNSDIWNEGSHKI